MAEKESSRVVDNELRQKMVDLLIEHGLYTPESDEGALFRVKNWEFALNFTGSERPTFLRIVQGKEEVDAYDLAEDYQHETARKAEEAAERQRKKEAKIAADEKKRAAKAEKTD